MKITKRQLREFIKEAVVAALNEQEQASEEACSVFPDKIKAELEGLAQKFGYQQFEDPSSILSYKNEQKNLEFAITCKPLQGKSFWGTTWKSKRSNGKGMSSGNVVDTVKQLIAWMEQRPGQTPWMKR